MDRWLFLIWKGVKELRLKSKGMEQEVEKADRFSQVVFLIVSINLLFSVDSILTVVGMTDVFLVMVGSVVISVMLMLWFAEYISNYMMSNPDFEILGLFVLLLIGFVLILEGGHFAHLTISGNAFPYIPQWIVIFIPFADVHGRCVSELGGAEAREEILFLCVGEKRRVWQGDKAGFGKNSLAASSRTKNSKSQILKYQTNNNDQNSKFEICFLFWSLKMLRAHPVRFGAGLARNLRFKNAPPLPLHFEVSLSRFSPAKAGLGNQYCNLRFVW